MKKLVVIFSLILVTTGAWAEWTGAAMWADLKTYDQAVTEAGAFAAGYSEAMVSSNIMSDQANRAWFLANLQVGAVDLYLTADKFYQAQENANCPTVTALKLCLEQLIAKTPDGVKLLNIVYQNVGGWKNIKSWPEYQASKNQ